jgi:anti-anti-sigma factor
MHVGRSESLAGCMVTWSDAQVALSGEIDELNADTVADRLCAGLAGPVMVVDLTAVRFFSAAGVRMLAKLGVAASGVDAIAHVTCSSAVWRIMDVCGGTDLPGLVLDRTGDGAPT